MYFKTETGPVRVNPTMMKSQRDVDDQIEVMQKYTIWGFLGLIVLIILVFIVSYCVYKSYLKEMFRKNARYGNLID